MHFFSRPLIGPEITWSVPRPLIGHPPYTPPSPPKKKFMKLALSVHFCQYWYWCYPYAGFFVVEYFPWLQKHHNSTEVHQRPCNAEWCFLGLEVSLYLVARYFCSFKGISIFEPINGCSIYCCAAISYWDYPRTGKGQFHHLNVLNLQRSLVDRPLPYYHSFQQNNTRDLGEVYQTAPAVPNVVN